MRSAHKAEFEEAFEPYEFSAEATKDGEPFMITHDVYAGGMGPPVILLHEIDGFREAVMRLALRLRADGFRVYLPRFFGRPWVPQRAAEAIGFFKVCIRKEFYFYVAGKESPVAGWVRALAKAVAERDGTSKVGVIGMCMTGGVALATVSQPEVGAAVSAQPALPWAVGVWPFKTGKRKRDLGVNDPAALAAGGTPVLGLRFCGDNLSPEERLCVLAKLPNATVVNPPGDGHPTLTAAFRKGMAPHAGSEAAIAEAVKFLHGHLAVEPAAGEG